MYTFNFTSIFIFISILSSGCCTSINDAVSSSLSILDSLFPDNPSQESEIPPPSPPLSQQQSQQTPIQLFHQCIHGNIGPSNLAPQNGSSPSQATLITPESPRYSNLSVGHRARITRKPAAIFLARSESDVVQAVHCAFQSGIRPVPRCGGHSYEGFSSQDDAVIIDLIGLQSVKVEPPRIPDKAVIARVGGGVRLGNLYIELWKQGQYTFNAGVCPSVGIGGHVSGGGYGMSARKFGLAADRVVNMRVVLYNGTLLESVSATNYADLFWALRGGGSGSFGIITEFTIQVFQEPVNTMFSIMYDPSYTFDLVRAWTDYFPHSDHRLTTQLNVRADFVQLVGQFHGPLQDLNFFLNQSGMSHLEMIIHDVRTEKCNALEAKGFIETGNCTSEPLQVPLSYDTYGSVHVNTTHFDERDYGMYKSNYVNKRFPDEAIQALISSLSHAPNGSWIQFEAYGGIFSNQTNHDTPFANRDMLFSMQYASPLPKRTIAPLMAVNAKTRTTSWKEVVVSESWTREFERAMSPYVAPNRYQNYPDLDIDPRKFGIAYWGAENFENLKKVKRLYDPLNVFRNEQSVPL